MLYDLNVAWSPATTPSQLAALLSHAAALGYDTVALNHELTLPFPANPVAPFPSADAVRSASASAARLPAILHRATLPLADPAASNYRLPALAAAYDVLAVRPLTDKAFQNACLTLDLPLISLDLGTHFDFHFRPKPCMAAVARGVRFEVCYAQALAADARRRANFISNVTNLVRATRGRGILLSSEAADALALRAPADVVNLLTVWGLPADKAMEGLRAVPRSLVVNEGIKRSGFRGVIDIVQTAESDANDPRVQRQAADEGQSTKRSRKQTQTQNQNQKRKSDNDDGQAARKRQAKKLRLASRAAPPDQK